MNKLNEKLKKKFEKEKKRQGKQKAVERKKEKREREKVKEKPLTSITKLFDIQSQLKEQNKEYINKIFKNNALLYRAGINNKLKKDIKNENQELKNKGK